MALSLEYFSCIKQILSNFSSSADWGESSGQFWARNRRVGPLSNLFRDWASYKPDESIHDANETAHQSEMSSSLPPKLNDLSEVPRALSNRSRYVIVVNSKVGFLMAVLRFFLWRITSPACRKCRQSRIFQCYPPQFSREFPKVSESVSATKSQKTTFSTLRRWKLPSNNPSLTTLALLSGRSPSSCAVSSLDDASRWKP